VACTFAQHDAKKHGFVYVLGLPQLSGAVTASSENGIHIVRLLSACPPNALRPHYQEGFLLCEYPVPTRDAREAYQRYEFDWARRLIGKFRIPAGKSFWPKGFTPLDWNASLFPDERDPLCKLVGGIEL
jgi:hypothetical protein